MTCLRRASGGTVRLTYDYRGLRSAGVDGVRAAMPARYRALADVGAGLGLRQGEAFGLAVDDADFLHRVVHVRRQVRIVGSTLCFAPPKGGKERDIPLPDSIALRLSAHIAACPPVAGIAAVEGARRQAGDRQPAVHRAAAARRCTGSSFNAVACGSQRCRGRACRCSRGNGFHALRHYFAIGLPGTTGWTSAPWPPTSATTTPDSRCGPTCT